MRVYDGGSIVIIEPEDTTETDWILDHVSSEGFNPDYPERVHIERRYAVDILQGAEADGIALRPGR